MAAPLIFQHFLMSLSNFEIQPVWNLKYSAAATVEFDNDKTDSLFTLFVRIQV